MAGTNVSVGGGAKKKARIEIIPLIDVIFFLLATFVLFTLSLQRIASVPVTLPKADPTSRPPLDDTTVYLQVSDEGTFYWKFGNNPSPELISASEIAPRLNDYRNRFNNQARVL